ncbi:MAG: hypothetical protein KDK12_12740 [Rhodobacteraceae bacterium]|nr:hypothetical protein [Paracoccaceae bacterium]
MTRSRDEMELDLAFLVNGTLSEAEMAEMEALLAEDALLAAERDALATIRAEMQAEEVRSPGEFGLARLLRDVGRETAAPAEERSNVVPMRSRTWMWQAAAAVAVLALVTQTFLPRGTGAPDGGGYVLAGADQPGALVVSFAPGATEGRIRDLLLGAELEIVAGPSALGLYRLDVSEGGDLTAAADALRAAGDIVESVENAQN